MPGVASVSLLVLKSQHEEPFLPAHTVSHWKAVSKYCTDTQDIELEVTALDEVPCKANIRLCSRLGPPHKWELLLRNRYVKVLNRSDCCLYFSFAAAASQR